MKKKTITELINCDTSRLYGSLDDAIAYLQEVKQKYQKAYLAEHWTGYADMKMVFEYQREETDKEYGMRVQKEKEMREIRILQEKKEAERQERLEQYLSLKKEFG
jgi:hypothetical protein